MNPRLLFFGLYFLSIIFHTEASKTSNVLDLPVHKQNQLICAKILERMNKNFPVTYTAAQRANALSSQLDNIAKELLSSGLDLNAYTYRVDTESGYVQFEMVPLWEGTNIKHKIPLTLFVYIWPPERIAKKFAIDKGGSTKAGAQNAYATNIHGHPITCALTVLRGTLCQENYQAVKGWPYNVAQKKNEETLHPGAATFDDNQSPFIHRLLCRDMGDDPAYSLHAYGASSAKAVQELFRTTYSQYAYHFILNEEGKLTYQEW